MTKVRLVVEYTVKKGHADAVIDMFKTVFIPKSRSEQGCVFYELWQDNDTPDKLSVVEIWASMAALEQHIAQDWFKQWAPKVQALLDEEIINIMHSVEDTQEQDT